MAHLRWDLISITNQSGLLLRTGMIVAVIKAGGGLVALATVSVLTDVLVFLSFYIALRRIQDQFKLSFSLASISTLKGLLPYSLFTFIIKMNDQLRLYIDPVVVTAFVGVGAVTHYAIGQRLSLAFRDSMIALLACWHLGSAGYSAVEITERSGRCLSSGLGSRSRLRPQLRVSCCSTDGNSSSTGWARTT